MVKTFIFAQNQKRKFISVIQRLQTVFLALASLLNLSVYFTPIYDLFPYTTLLPIWYGLAVSLMIPMIMNVVCIFLYQNRKNQIVWVKRTALVQVIAFAFGVGVLLS
ncbi:MAG TPA: hypothetical protein DD671_11650, partial [Balneolaceae bacterium]|nr:hypothetical protein [Balneolaceae bacterium]